MIGFVVPFKPKANSKNWDNDSALLIATLKSICNQSSSDFKAYVVYHDLPNEGFDHPSLEYIKFPFEFCTIEMTTNRTTRHELDPVMTVNGFDQGKKSLYGATIAKNDGCEYIMSVDSDDLISNRIAEFVNNYQKQSDGWYITKGYIYMVKENLLIRKPSKMHTINGSTNIVASKHIPILDFESRNADHFSFFAAHGYLVNRLRAQNIHLLPLKFYAIVYVAHKSNWSNITNSYRIFSLRNVIIKTLRYQPKLKRLMKEFNLQ